MGLSNGFLARFQKRAFQDLMFITGNHKNDLFSVRSSTVHCISMKNDNFKIQLACFSKEMLLWQNWHFYKQMLYRSCYLYENYWIFIKSTQVSKNQIFFNFQKRAFHRLVNQSEILHLQSIWLKRLVTKLLEIYWFH